ncbi:MAG TPA: hypothetical protein VGP72_11450 [Planctomycetota bacterium]
MGARTWLRAKASSIGVGILGVLVCSAIILQVNAYSGKPKVKYQSLKGLVTDSHDRPLVGATVYFVDSALVDTTSPMTEAGIAAGATDGFDEPLEDIVNNATKAKTLPQAKTDKNGKFMVKKLNIGTTYFTFTVPDAKDTDHLPGGDASRIAFHPTAIGKTGLHVRMSWKTPEDATYIGTSACYVCHSEGSVADATPCKRHGHALMFNKPGQPTANQNPTAHPGANVTALQEKFTTAATFTATGVKTLYFQEYDASAKNFAVYEDTPGTKVDPTTGKAGDVWLKAVLWRTGVTSNYNITLINAKNAADGPVTWPVKLFMGAYIRQRIFVSMTDGRKSAYPILEYRSMPGSASQGANGSYDKSRVPFAESSFSSFYTYDSKTKTMTLSKTGPAATASNITCARCHLGLTTTTTFKDPITGESLAHTVNDANGVFDLGGDGSLQDVGISCEQCHGAGSKHREEALKGVTPPTSKKAAPVDNSAKFIINPSLLGADRASLICGRCHDARGVMREEAEEFPPPGISRAEFLAKFADTKALTPAQLWPDGEHGRGGHHGFTYDSFLQSKHYRNSRQLLSCDDCHDSMGDSNFRYFCKDDPDDPNSTLCQRCHAKDVAAHALEKTGNAMTGSSMACRQCHLARVGKAGAGRAGLLLGTPTGLSSDANQIYWEGDQASHSWDVPRKFSPGVAGVQPGLAMPIPYTNSCGTCHDASKLQFQGPQ